MVPNRVAIRERVFRKCSSSFLSPVSAWVPHSPDFPPPAGNLASSLAMSLSERDQRILREIEHSLVSSEAHLDRALSTGRLPALRLVPLVELHQGAKRQRQMWAAGAVASLLAGITLLVAGLMLNALVLTWVGMPLAQFGPAAIACMQRKRARRTQGHHRNVRAGHGLPRRKPYREGA
jgi:hypothetical protein